MSFNRFNQKIRALRTTPPAKAFYVSCAIAGLHRGWTQSKVSLHDVERLYVDRLAWGALYSGLYAWAHPIVFYCLLQQAEINTRKLFDTGYEPIDDPNILKILDVPHKDVYQIPSIAFPQIDYETICVSIEDVKRRASHYDV